MMRLTIRILLLCALFIPGAGRAQDWFSTGPGGGSGGGSSVSVTAANACIAINPSPGTGTFTVGGVAPNRKVASPTIASTDMCGQVIVTSGTITILAIGAGVFPIGSTLSLVNYINGSATVTSTPTINTGGGCVQASGIPAGDTWQLSADADGATLDCFQTVSAVAISQVTGLGTGVGTAATANLSAAGGLSSTIASGTSALGTGAISSATCATVVTTTATNIVTTDVIWWGFNGDPTGVTGYIPATAGMLTIIAYPSANNVNFKVCNNTASSITPGAITLNWRVVR